MGYETRKVMVVDDSSVMRQIIKNNLKQLGFELANLLDAEDGEEALKMINEDGGVDIVISDLGCKPFQRTSPLVRARSSEMAPVHKKIFYRKCLLARLSVGGKNINSL